ncbi:hypothetical protein AX17_005729 [Amanita inopinata Kibby_2008]|nr:hypothetical protein AX17_005729 [Amanita inopinata Kibby_2008]
MSKAKDTKPLPLANTLSDLAVLRASDLDLDSLLLARDSQPEPDYEVDGSYAFVREARMALRLHTSGEADTQGERVELIRSSLEKLVKDLQQRESD